MKYVKRVSLLLFFITINVLSQKFEEVSSSIGINHIYKQFSHMGGGAVFFDYDNDGWEDLYITSGLDKDHLYRNLGNGSFSKIEDSWLNITDNFYTTGVVSADVNNDGFRDLFVTTWKDFESSGAQGFQRNLLFINNGNGTFSEKGIEYNIDKEKFSMGALMLDYNKDGLIDIYVINYVENSNLEYDGSGEIVGFNHDCFENTLYKNNGNNTFTDVSQDSGANNKGCGLAGIPTDYDQDYDQDIYVANDFGAYIFSNSILENQYPESNFIDKSSDSKMDIKIFAMGISYADIDKDLDYDYYITNLGRNVLLENNGSNVFTDIATSAGVENTHAENTNNTLYTTGWGTAFFDFNNDSWQDLFVANGRVPSASFIATGEDDPNKMYLNNGDGTFKDISEDAGVNDFSRGRGMAFSDYDKDGDIDVVVVVQDGSQNSGARTTFYQNQLNPESNNSVNWIQFELIGTTINKNALGAKVEITVNGDKLIQEVHGQGSHCSQHSLVLHYGLESATILDELKIYWAKDDIQTFTNLDTNKRYVITQGSSLNINSFEKENGIIVYPNPVKDFISFKNFKKDIRVKIFDMYGKMIQETDVNKMTPNLEVKALARGTYLFQVFDLDTSELVKTSLVIKD